MTMHEGHRGRLKDRFKKEGLEHFSEINILELLLFYSVPRKDTNPIAHNLLNKFGSFANVLEAHFEELLEVDGITENSATLLKLLLPTYRHYFKSKEKPNMIVTNIETAGEYLAKSYIGHINEIAKLMALDSKNRVIGIYTLIEGNINSINISMRKIVEIALLSKAVSVIISHNHPGGIALPSEDDIKTTHEIRRALKAISVELLDHIVIADDDFVSMNQSGFFIDRHR